MRRRTAGTTRVEGGMEEGNAHREGLVVCGDNARFLTSRKSERGATPRRSFSTCEILAGCISFVNLATTRPYRRGLIRSRGIAIKK